MAAAASEPLRYSSKAEAFRNWPAGLQPSDPWRGQGLLIALERI